MAGDKFMPEMHLRQSGFRYSACGQFAKNKERMKKFTEIGDSRYIYHNELDKSCFQHDMAYEDFTDLSRRTDSNLLLCGKGYNIGRHWKYDGYQHGLFSMVYKFFDKRSSVDAIKNEIVPNQYPLDLATWQLPQELHKPINKKFEKGNV